MKNECARPDNATPNHESEHAPLGGHVLNLDAGDADLERDLLRILDRLVLLLILAHLLVHDRRGLLDDLVEEDESTIRAVIAMQRMSRHLEYGDELVTVRRGSVIRQRRGNIWVDGDETMEVGGSTIFRRNKLTKAA